MAPAASRAHETARMWLRLIANDRIGEDVIRLTYVPAQSDRQIFGWLPTGPAEPFFDSAFR
jgi:hypothetical protein